MNREKMAVYLTELRKEKGLSQSNLAEMIGVTFQAVSKWERAEAIPDIAILEQLASLYGVTIDEIINGESKQIRQFEEKEASISFLKQNRSIGFWISISFMILYFLCGFFSYLVRANYYQLLFSNNYRIGNYFLLIQFLIILSIPIITMLFYACGNIQSFEKMYSARKIMSIISLCSTGFILAYVIVEIVRGGIPSIGIGFLFLQGLIIAYNVLCLVFKKMKKPYLIKDFQQ